jgi:protein-tyrosine phosphatase
LGSAAESLDWIPGMSAVGRRLARRCWPGPLTLVFGDGVTEGLLSRLPENVRRSVAPAGTLGLRVPAHEAILHTLHELRGPLVLSSANRSGESPATTAEAVMETVGDAAALIIDDGPCRYGQPSTVVQVNGDSWTILRPGVLSLEQLEQQACRLIVFVCTGNTCRSPLAEALCKKMLAEGLGCGLEELPRRGYLVVSAGMAASNGMEATAEAVAAAQELGVDLQEHASRPLTPRLASQADDLIVMTQAHREALEAHFCGFNLRPRLLSPNGEDVPDPIGCEQAVYENCARLIHNHLLKIVAELLA